MAIADAFQKMQFHEMAMVGTGMTNRLPTWVPTGEWAEEGETRGKCLDSGKEFSACPAFPARAE
jgi:hypothetical protein